MDVVFSWEVRALVLVPMGVVCYLGNQFNVSVAIGVLGITITALTDLVFSVGVTLAFLVPLWSVITEQMTQQRFNKKLHKVTIVTALGSTVVVFSGTLLYLNGFAFYLWHARMSQITWLNCYVVGGNLDSILNDLGMLLISVGVAYIVMPVKKKRKRKHRYTKAQASPFGQPVVLNRFFFRGSQQT